MRKSIKKNIFLSSFILMACLFMGINTALADDPVAVEPIGAGTSGEPYQIATWQNLYWISQNHTDERLLNKYYIQTAEIDFADAVPAITEWDGGAGWTPIGDGDTSAWPYNQFYNSSYDGQGHSIKNLYINRPDTDNTGLFGFIYSKSKLLNITLDSVNITGKNYVGGLVGRTDQGTSIDNCSVGGRVEGVEYVGGLAGYNYRGSNDTTLRAFIKNSNSSANVIGTENVGGLVGADYYRTTISNNYVTGDVEAKEGTVGRQFGGLIGYAQGDNIIENSFSAGNVRTNGARLHSATYLIMAGGLIGKTGHDSNFPVTVENCYSSADVQVDYGNYIGGLIGNSTYTNISKSYSTGNVSGGTGSENGVSNSTYVGGLVGYLYYSDITDSYSASNVSGYQMVGGLVGSAWEKFEAEHMINNSFSVGTVAGTLNLGGLIGDASEWTNPLNQTIANSFWDNEASGQETSDGGTGKTPAEMKSISTFTDTQTVGLDVPWDMVLIGDYVDEVWQIDDGNSYPKLGWQPNQYTLIYSAGLGGSISGNSSQLVNEGLSGTAVTAVPDENYNFVDWLDDSTDNPRTDTNVTDNISVTANFAINTYTVAYAAGSGGNISGEVSQTVSHGDDASTVEAAADSGYYFVDWSDDSTDNPRTDTNVTDNISVTANFAQEEQEGDNQSNDGGNSSGVNHFKPIPIGDGAVDIAIPMNEAKPVGDIGAGGINAFMYINSRADFSALVSRTRSMENHGLRIAEMDIAGKKIKIIIYSEPIFFDLSLGEKKQVDLDKDGVNDIEISFVGLVINRAEITIKELDFAKTAKRKNEEVVGKTEALFPVLVITNQSLYSRIKGRIILRVEENGEAYYVHPVEQEMRYLGRPDDAFIIMRDQGIGITDEDLLKFRTSEEAGQVSSEEVSAFARKHKGKIFLQVEQNGEAWYINPADSRRYYLGRPQDAFNIMKSLGLGISNADFEKL